MIQFDIWTSSSTSLIKRVTNSRTHCVIDTEIVRTLLRVYLYAYCCQLKGTRRSKECNELARFFEKAVSHYWWLFGAFIGDKQFNYG